MSGYTEPGNGHEGLFPLRQHQEAPPYRVEMASIDKDHRNRKDSTFALCLDRTEDGHEDRLCENIAAQGGAVGERKVELSIMV